MSDNVRNLPATTAKNATALVSSSTALVALHQVMDRVLSDPAFPIETVERMVNLGMMMLKEEQRIGYFDAMAELQSEIEPVFRRKPNAGAGGRPYAPREDIMAMLQPKLSKHRFAVNIGEIEGAPEGKVRMEITVSRGGHTERRYRDFPTVFKGAFGKAIAMTEQQMVVAVDTYAMRALITTFFHITTDEDDDGEATRETNYGGNDKPHDKPQDDATAAQRGWRGKNVAQWADTLVARLAAAQSLEGIDDLLNTPPVSEWLADQAGGPTKEERTKISVARMDATKRVVGATPSTAAPDPAVVGRTMDNYDRGEARRKADQATETGESAKPIDHAAELIAHIASRSTSAALKSLEMEPEFLKALADLFPVDGERVQSFLVAKRTELEAKGV